MDDNVERKCVTSGNDSKVECVASGDDRHWRRLFSGCKLFNYPSPADKSATSHARGEVTGLNDYRVVQCGRSMIEMLGVLAIIGVLSVGGIAGYSKAMLMWRSNIQKNMLTEIITNMIKIRPNLNKVQIFSNITPIFDAMGELPEGTTYQNGYIYDKDGNRVDISYGLQTLNYSDGHKTEELIYVVRFWFMSNEKRLTPSAIVYCRNLVEAAQSVVSGLHLFKRILKASLVQVANYYLIKIV